MSSVLLSLIFLVLKKVVDAQTEMSTIIDTRKKKITLLCYLL